MIRSFAATQAPTMNVPAPLQSQKVQIALVAIVVIGGGVAGAFATGVFDSTPKAPADQVPADVDAVIYVDGDIVTDDATKTAMNTMLQQSPSSEVDSYDDLLAQAENESDLDLKKFNEMIAFSKAPNGSTTGVATSPSTDYTGAIIYSEWSEDAFVNTTTTDAMVEYTETEYNGHTLHKPASQPEFGSADWIGVLDDGTFVVGTEQAVKDTIDVTEGNHDTFSGTLRSEYDSLNDGYVKFAVDVPQDQLSEDDFANPGSQLNTNVYANTDMVTGVYFTESESVTLRTHLIATDESAASDIKDVTDGGISLARGSLTNETVKNTLDAITVEQDGSKVTVEYEASVDRITALIRFFANYSPYGPTTV